MAKNNVSINIGANTKDAEKGINKVQGEINSFKKNLGTLSNLGSISSGLSAAFSMVSGAVNKVSATIKDLTDTYKIQAKAEVQLETAAKNNPFLDEGNVRALKNYASELQGISTVGDEQLLPMMAQLAAAGRTQNEIQDIMSAALDASASGAISLDAAVKGLNASYSGNVGQLSRTIPALKNLTKEELKSGEAIRVVANQFKGMAEETAKATGTSEQLSNAWGDLKENLGKGLEEALAPARKTLTGLIADLNNFISSSRELKNAQKNISAGNATIADWDVMIEKLQKERESVQKVMYKAIATYENTGLDNGIAEIKNEFMEISKKINIAEASRKKLKDIADQEAAAQKKIADDAARAAEAQRLAAENMQKWLNARDSAKSSFEQNASLSENLSPAEQIQKEIEILNASYEEYFKYLKEGSAQEIAAKEALYAKLQELGNAYREAERAADEEAMRAKYKQITDTARQIDGIVKSLSDSITTFSDIAQEKASAEAEIRMAEIEKQYEDGIISLEEYNEKKEQIDKEAKQKSYKAEMWAWSSQLIAATANIAASMIQAMADPTIPSTAGKIAMAAVIAAAGAAQLATVISNKPTPPAFATGGFIPGTSYSGDNVLARVNSGEAVLNAAQQRNFMNLANGGAAGGGINVVVNNSASNLVSAQPQISKGKIELMIDARVNEGLRNGKYNSSLEIANNSHSGELYAM